MVNEVDESVAEESEDVDYKISSMKINDCYSFKSRCMF